MIPNEVQPSYVYSTIQKNSSLELFMIKYINVKAETSETQLY